MIYIIYRSRDYIDYSQPQAIGAFTDYEKARDYCNKMSTSHVRYFYEEVELLD